MKTTQKQMVYDLLIDNGDEFKPTFWFVGERFCKSKCEWYLLSYKCPARLSDLYNEGLVERKTVKGKTGATYYSYRIKQ